MQVGKQPGGHDLPHVSLPSFYQAEVLRERNHLDAARALIEEAIFLGEQVESYAALASISMDTPYCYVFTCPAENWMRHTLPFRKLKTSAGG